MSSKGVLTNFTPADFAAAAIGGAAAPAAGGGQTGPDATDAPVENVVIDAPAPPPPAASKSKSSRKTAGAGDAPDMVLPDEV